MCLRGWKTTRRKSSSSVSSFRGLVVKRSNSSVLHPGHFPYSWDKFNPHIWTLPLSSWDVNAVTSAGTHPLTFKEELDIRQGRKKKKGCSKIPNCQIHRNLPSPGCTLPPTSKPVGELVGWHGWKGQEESRTAEPKRSEWFYSVGGAASMSCPPGICGQE